MVEGIERRSLGVRWLEWEEGVRMLQEGKIIAKFVF